MKRKMLICLALIGFMNCAHAVKVSPIRFDMSIARGSSKDFVLNLTGSKGSYNQDLLIYPSNLFMSRTGALTFDIREEESKNSCIKWIKIEKSKLSLLEDQVSKVKFKISIPSNATPGEYYAVIMVEPQKFSSIKDKNRPVMLQMKSRVAIVVVLEVPGRTYEKKGEAVEVKILETDSLIKISSSFKNTGNIHLDVTNQVTIRSADGKINYGIFDSKALNNSKNEAFIFPNATRDFEGILKRQLPAGDYLAETSFNYGYSFNKAHLTQKFSVKRKTSLNENSLEFIGLKNKELRLLIPKGGTRTQIITVTNIDYRPLNVVMTSPDWIHIVPNNLSLKPGEVRNFMISIYISDYDQSQQKEAIISFKTDRGKGSEMKLYVTGSKIISVRDTLNINKKMLKK